MYVRRDRAAIAWDGRSKYYEKLCPCEYEEPMDLYGYKVEAPWITYYSSDEDEELEANAAITAKKNAAAAAAAEAAELENLSPSPEVPSSSGITYMDDYYTSDDDDEIMEPVPAAAPVASSSAMAQQEDLNQI